MIFAYYGGILIGRDTAIDTNGKFVGYGYTGSSNSQNRTIQEATLGFNQTLWKHPKYGAVNIIGQYSYLTRDPWNIATAPPVTRNTPTQISICCSSTCATRCPARLQP